MAVFSYEAIDGSGQQVAGRIEAEQDMTAVERLRKMGLTVVDMNEVRVAAGGGLFQSRKKVTIGDLALFSRQLESMLNAGIPLTRVLFTLARQVEIPSFREALNEIGRNVEGGMSFADALAAFPGIFPDVYVNMIRAGEAGGSLEIMLQQLSGQLERDKALQDNIKSATFYPKMVLGFALLVVIAMMIFMVPMFMGFLPKDVNPPLLTKIVFVSSDLLRHYWYLFIAGAMALFAGSRMFLRSPVGVRLWDRWKFRTPAFGSLLHKAVIARFCRILSTLLSGGLPVLQALEYAGPASGNVLVAEAVAAAGAKIHEGKSIAVPLEESGLFPPMVIQMVSTGEETGNLSSLLSRVAGFYEEEVATMTKGLTALIEPILLIAVGITVGLMVIAMYLPIFMLVTQSTG
ncbi:MAG: type II secretion system F family protein [Desulfotomaculaceae bacterium]|nr:type II secretion system F family protein [Desulfotomaculaceae bacterium]